MLKEIKEFIEGVISVLVVASITPYVFSWIMEVRRDNKRKIKHLVFNHGYTEKEAIKFLEKKDLIIPINGSSHKQDSTNKIMREENDRNKK